MLCGYKSWKSILRRFLRVDLGFEPGTELRPVMILEMAVSSSEAMKVRQCLARLVAT